MRTHLIPASKMEQAKSSVQSLGVETGQPPLRGHWQLNNCRRDRVGVRFTGEKGIPKTSEREGPWGKFDAPKVLTPNTAWSRSSLPRDNGLPTSATLRFARQSDPICAGWTQMNMRRYNVIMSAAHGSLLYTRVGTVLAGEITEGMPGRS